MAPKLRPPAIEVQKASASSITVTDTMTLVVTDESTGKELRVKDGLVGRATTPAMPLSKDDDSVPILSTIRFEELRVGDILGHGSQGKVRLVQHKSTLKLYAMKYIEYEGKSEEAREVLAAELRQVHALKHEHIVSSFEAFFRKSRLCIVMEYMDAGSMSDIICRHQDAFPEDLVAYVARCLFLGLSHIHKQKILHRDIKPANVLANRKGDVKISDFGISKTFSDQQTKTISIKGSTPYMSPEMITAQPYSFGSDIWSAGLTIAECAIGAYPFVFKKAGAFEHYEVVIKGSEAVQWDQRQRAISTELKELVQLCLRPASERPSAEELLRHPFVKRAENVTSEDAGRWFLEGKAQ